jgi:glucan-binding YG repeat protein
MKNLITMIVVGVFFVTSCTQTEGKKEKEVSKKDQHKEIIISYIKDNTNDPESFELVELELLDSTLYRENIAFRKEYFSREKSEKNRAILEGINQIEKELGDTVNHVASYKYYVKFRNTNGFGAKVLNEFVAQTDGDPVTKVINFTNDQDKILLNPNGFPGYKEMVMKHY